MKVSFLQKYYPQDFSGLVTKNHLGGIYQIEPQWASKLAKRIHAINFGMDLDTYLDKFSPKYLDTDDEFKWVLQGTNDKNIPLVEARVDGVAVTAADRPGLNFTEFELIFPEAYFSDTNVIVGEQNELYSILIKEGPINEGGNFRYVCELLTGDETLFIPFEELQAGKRFSKEWSPVEQTLSTKGGQPHYTSPFQMSNIFTMIRMEKTVPGNMISRPVAFAWKSEDGKKVYNTWLQYSDYEFDRQFRVMKSKLLMYGTYNKASDGTFKQKGKSGYDIQQGAGIKQQMETSNVAFYNKFDIKWLTNVLLDLSVGKLGEGEREFVLRTGERGMVQFHEALSEYASLYTPLRDQNRVSLSGNSLTFKGQFMEYMGPQGIKVTLMHDPMKDNPERNKILHPNGGTAESYVYDILDMGNNQDGEPNIRKVYVKGSEYLMGYEPGLRDPFSPTLKNNIMSTSVDGYKVHRATVCGAMVMDPTRTATLKPSILNI
jgi:hypothetical protein